MSSKPAISVRGLSKQYRIKHKRSSPTSLTDLLRGGWHRDTQETFWALKDASFEVAEGEAVGIIGHNGAGKSTLLKILSRIVEPTSGEAIMRGRLGSLLEVGTGFHPELTGRENIFLNGSILGMRRKEVQREFDAIVDFSGIERFLDTPVKRYSSGMYVRLAFAVAAHLQADILIVDEVLAVGDAAFQAKCLKKMDEVGKAGRTVLLVSHNMAPISALTQRCLLLEHGGVTFDGQTEAAVERYLSVAAAATLGASYAAPANASRPTITEVTLETSHPAQLQAHGAALRVLIQLKTPIAVSGARLSVLIRDRLSRSTSHSWLYDSERPFCRTPGVYEFVCRLPTVRLAPGDYTLTVVFAEFSGGAVFERIENICSFEVAMLGRMREGGWEKNVIAYFEDTEWTIGSGGPLTAESDVGRQAISSPTETWSAVVPVVPDRKGP